MIYDQELQDWLDKCPHHDHEILHSDEDGVVIVFRFNNQQEEKWVEEDLKVLKY